MKCLLPAFCTLFLLLCLGCHENKNQIFVYNGATYLDFKLEFATDTTSVDFIDWKKEHPVSEFTLNGKAPLQYSVTLINGTLASLSQFKGWKWHHQENLNITGLTISRITGKHIISEFNITDFDHDGDEDLMVWVAGNMNTNRWLLIFINDQEHQKLVRLYDTADGSDIWNDPKYNEAKGIINCELYSGAYGIQNTSSYKLNGTTAAPLIKNETDLTNEIIVETKYIGENGKWKKASQEIDN